MPPRLVELRRMLYIECTSNNPEVCTASHCNFAHSDAPATAVVRLSQGTHPALPAAAAHRCLSCVCPHKISHFVHFLGQHRGLYTLGPSSSG